MRQETPELEPAHTLSLPQADSGWRVFQLPELPYRQDALEPYVSAMALHFHHSRHHQSYVDNLNKMVAGTAFSMLPLEDLIQKTVAMPDKSALFNNAAQVWNHTFFWHSMKPGGGGLPSARLLEMITDAFGSFETFRNAFMTAAVSQFGSGGAWLIQDADKVRVIKTTNAETPIAYGQNALLTCDVWEHAYYLDYQNRRKDYVQNFIDHLANWEFAASKITWHA